MVFNCQLGLVKKGTQRATRLVEANSTSLRSHQLVSVGEPLARFCATSERVEGGGLATHQATNEPPRITNRAFNTSPRRALPSAAGHHFRHPHPSPPQNPESAHKRAKPASRPKDKKAAEQTKTKTGPAALVTLSAAAARACSTFVLTHAGGVPCVFRAAHANAAHEADTRERGPCRPAHTTAGLAHAHTHACASERASEHTHKAGRFCCSCGKRLWAASSWKLYAAAPNRGESATAARRKSWPLKVKERQQAFSPNKKFPQLHVPEERATAFSPNAVC